MSTTLNTLKSLVLENTPDLNTDTDTIHIQLYSYMGMLKISDVSVRRGSNYVNIQSTFSLSEHKELIIKIIEQSGIHYTPTMALSYRPNTITIPYEVWWDITYFPMDNLASVECTTSNKSIGRVYSIDE